VFFNISFVSVHIFCVFFKVSFVSVPIFFKVLGQMAMAISLA
jgi:hypothetical protein